MRASRSVDQRLRLAVLAILVRARIDLGGQHGHSRHSSGARRTHPPRPASAAVAPASDRMAEAPSTAKLVKCRKRRSSLRPALHDIRTSMCSSRLRIKSATFAHPCAAVAPGILTPATFAHPCAAVAPGILHSATFAHPCAASAPCGARIQRIGVAWIRGDLLLRILVVVHLVVGGFRSGLGSIGGLLRFLPSRWRWLPGSRRAARSALRLQTPEAAACAVSWTAPALSAWALASAVGHVGLCLGGVGLLRGLPLRGIAAREGGGQ